MNDDVIDKRNFKKVAVVGSVIDFRRFFKETKNRSYIDYGSQTEYVCIYNEMSCVGRNFDEAILVSKGLNYLKIYKEIRDKRMRN